MVFFTTFLAAGAFFAGALTAFSPTLGAIASESECASASESKFDFKNAFNTLWALKSSEVICLEALNPIVVVENHFI